MSVFNHLIYFGLIILVTLWGFLATAIILLYMAVTYPFQGQTPAYNYLYSKILSLPLVRFLGWKIVCEGKEYLNLAQPCVYVANHQSNFDIVSYGPLFPAQTVCIGKKELKWVPLFGQFFAASGNIMIDRSNRTQAVAGLQQAQEAMLEKGRSIWIFPEGTRNRGKSDLLPFKRGAFYMAIASKRPIVAIVHQPLKTYLDAPRRKFKRTQIRIKVLPPFETAHLSLNDAHQLLATVQNAMAEAIKSLV